MLHFAKGLQSWACGCHFRRSDLICDANTSKSAILSFTRRRQVTARGHSLHRSHAAAEMTTHLSLAAVKGKADDNGDLYTSVLLNGLSNGVATEDAEAIVQESLPEAFVFDSIESALEDIALGRFVVVLDDEHRENEGDLVAAAELVTTESIAFMVEHTSGVLCVGMEGEDLDRLKLPLMVPPSQNTDSKCTAFTITVDLGIGTTTGISASDRAKTLRALASNTTSPSDLRRPGHIFPLRYEEGGVLKRRGHTEASVDLARLAGCRPAGVLCEIVNRVDGSMARTSQLFEFARQHGLKIITIEDLVQYRERHESL